MAPHFLQDTFLKTTFQAILQINMSFEPHYPVTSPPYLVLCFGLCDAWTHYDISCLRCFACALCRACKAPLSHPHLLSGLLLNFEAFPDLLSSELHYTLFHLYHCILRDYIKILYLYVFPQEMEFSKGRDPQLGTKQSLNVF